MSAVSPDLRRSVAQRAAHCCEYCRLPQACQVATFPVDHVTPRSRGGETELANLALACPQCNAVKWIHTLAVDPETGAEVPLFNPREHTWDEHFAWSPSKPEMLEARTAIGRATLAFLGLNAPRRMEIRRWLSDMGMHPPT